MAAILAAERGRVFTETEECFNFYFRAGMKLTPFDSSDKKALKRDFHRVGRKLAEDFLEAVRTGNHKAIFEMAKTLKFVTQFKPSPTTGDPHRKKILMLKRIATAKGAKWPIKFLAKIICWPHKNTDDGLSQLRRICKELNFPITPEKVFREHAKVNKRAR